MTCSRPVDSVPRETFLKEQQKTGWRDVYPQCYGAIIEQLPYMKAHEEVVDIGSWTVDTMVFTDHSPDETKCGSAPNGLIPCMHRIEEQCVRKLNSKVGESIIREVMITGKAEVNQDYIDIIETAGCGCPVDVYVEV